MKPGKPLSRKTPMRRVSAKRKAYKASDEGKAGKAHMGRVAALPCVICGARPVEVHHVIHGRYSARKSSDLDTIPLCVAHHRIGPDAIHNGKETWAAKYGPDYSYLQAVAEALKKPAPS